MSYYRPSSVIVEIGRLVVGVAVFLVLPLALATVITMLPAAFVSWAFTHEAVLAVWRAGPGGGWGIWLTLFLTPSVSYAVWMAYKWPQVLSKTAQQDPKYEDARRYFMD